MSENRLHYEDVRKIIAVYAPEMAAQFADRWSRWPAGANAVEISQRLHDVAATYSKIDPSITDNMIDAAIEITRRAE